MFSTVKKIYTRGEWDTYVFGFVLSKLSIVNVFRAVVLEESAAKYCFAFLIFEHG